MAERTVHVFLLVSEPETHFGGEDVGPQDIVCLSRTKLDTTFPFCPERAREFFRCARNVNGFEREYCEEPTSIDTPVGRVFYVRTVLESNLIIQYDAGLIGCNIIAMCCQ